MNKQQQKLLHPYPDGWYALCLSKELKPREVRSITFMGKELVLYRTELGKANLIDAHCPHLGAHFGHGGEVKGECIKCPFHGFEFDSEGRCAATPYGSKAPKHIKTHTHTVHERNGLVLAFADHLGRSPDWEIPELDQRGWSSLRLREWRIKGHPQDVHENSVDVGHFSEVHGYSGPTPEKKITCDGPHLNTRVFFVREKPMLNRSLTTKLSINLYGVGYGVVDIFIAEFQIRGRLMVLPTPESDGYIKLRAVLSVHNSIDPKLIHKWLGFISPVVMQQVFAYEMLRQISHDIEQDFKIWNHKRFIPSPPLIKGDGPVANFRRWAEQFYATSQTGGAIEPSAEANSRDIDVVTI